MLRLRDIALAVVLAAGFVAAMPHIAWSTVSNTTTSTTTSYGTGSQTVYVPGIDFRDNSWLTVTLYDTSTNPVTVSVVTQGSGANQWQPTGGLNPCVSITLGTALTASQYIVFTRNVPLTQPVVFNSASIFPYQGVSNQLDQMTLGLQNLAQSVIQSNGFNTTVPGSGQIPIGNGQTYTAANLSQGSGIVVTNGPGTIGIAEQYPMPTPSVSGQVVTATTGGYQTVPFFPLPSPTVSGQVVTSNSTGYAPVPFFPNPTPTTGDYLVGSGGAWVATPTPTPLPPATTANNVLTANGSAWVSASIPSITYTAPKVTQLTNFGAYATANLTNGSICTSTLTSAYGTPWPGTGIQDNSHLTAIPVGTYVVAVPGSCSAGQLQMSAAATQTTTGDQLYFGQMETATANTSTSSPCLTSISSYPYGVVIGSPVLDAKFAGSAIASGITVVGLPGSCSAGQIQMSANAHGTASAEPIAFGQVFTTPANALALNVKMVGGGGGGGASGTAGMGTPGSGVGTYFGTNSATGGLSGTSGGSGGGAGSTNLGTGWNGIQASGAYANLTSLSSVANTFGGAGAASAFGGGGPSSNAAGSNGVVYGAGGGGGATGGTSGFVGSGGGSGGYMDLLTTSTPAGSYPFYVDGGGAGGTAGTSGFAGGAGAPGVIYVEVRFQ